MLVIDPKDVERLTQAPPTLPEEQRRLARETAAAALALVAPEDRVAVLLTQPEVAALADAAKTAMMQWHGLSDMVRKRNRRFGWVPLLAADDAEARIYREAAAMLAPWRKAKEGRSDDRRA